MLNAPFSGRRFKIRADQSRNRKTAKKGEGAKEVGNVQKSSGGKTLIFSNIIDFPGTTECLSQAGLVIFKSDRFGVEK